MDLGAIGYNGQDYIQAAGKNTQEAGKTQSGIKAGNKGETAEHTDFSLKYVQAQENSGKNENEKSDSKTESEVIVRADGSKVLMMTTHIGRAETMMSIQISGPSTLQNNKADIDLSESAYGK